MGFLKKLFGRVLEQTSPPDNTLAQQFDAEWFAVLERYHIVAGIVGQRRHGLPPPQMSDLPPPHVGLKEIFREWQELPNLCNRRRLFYSKITGSGSGGFNKVWQAANFLVADSRGDEALEMLERKALPVEGAEDYGPHCAAYAKTYIALTREREAIDWARKAVAASPEEKPFLTVLGDALHLSGEHVEAHEIYEKQLANLTLSATSQTEVVREMFTEIFALETGVLHSPVMAFQFTQIQADAKQTAEFWALAEGEFYYSPYFRCKHAYYLAEQGEMTRFVAKLYGIVDEMPWVKEANLNFASAMEQFDPTGQNIFPETQAAVKERIRANGWTVEGAHVTEIDFGSPQG